MKKLTVPLSLLIVFAAGETQSTDFQGRLLLHKQAISEGKSLGVAGWFVVPDISTLRPIKNLIVGGLCYKDSALWVEVMGGAMLTSTAVGDTSTQTVEFVGDVRLLCRDVLSFNTYCEFFLRPSNPVMTIVISRQFISSKCVKISCGIESELFTQKEVQIGPRLTLVYKTLSITAARQYAEHHNILRVYTLLNL